MLSNLPKIIKFEFISNIKCADGMCLMENVSALSFKNI